MMSETTKALGSTNRGENLTEGELRLYRSGKCES